MAVRRSKIPLNDRRIRTFPRGLGLTRQSHARRTVSALYEHERVHHVGLSRGSMRIHG